MLAGAVTAAMLGSLVACSSGSGADETSNSSTSGASTSAESSSEPSGSGVELHMTVWTSNPDALAMFDSIGKAFVAQQPAVSAVKFDSLKLDQLDTVITTGIQAGDPPDLSWLPVEKSLEYIHNDALVDLAPALKATEGYDFDDLVPSLQERWTVGDSLYGVPFSTGALVMAYNEDLYEQAGVKSPADLIAEGNWTWDSFRDISKQVHDKLGVTGYVMNDFDYKNWTRLLPVLFAYGASPWNDEATQCTADSKEFADAIQLYHDMVYVDGSAPVPGQTVDFWGGQAAATTAFLGSMSVLKDATFKYNVVPTPAGPAGDTQALGQASIVVLAAGKHQDLATEFMAFLTNKTNAETMAQFYPPTRASLLSAKVLVGNSTVLTEDMVQPIVDATKSTGKIFPVAVDDAKVADALNRSLDTNIWQKDVNIQDALTKVCGDVQPLLK
jgi:multiple sugar transport system substrate-binding protein